MTMTLKNAEYSQTVRGRGKDIHMVYLPPFLSIRKVSWCWLPVRLVPTESQAEHETECPKVPRMESHPPMQDQSYRSSSRMETAWVLKMFEWSCTTRWGGCWNTKTYLEMVIFPLTVLSKKASLKERIAYLTESCVSVMSRRELKGDWGNSKVPNEYRQKILWWKSHLA